MMESWRLSCGHRHGHRTDYHSDHHYELRHGRHRVRRGDNRSDLHHGQFGGVTPHLLLFGAKRITVETVSRPACFSTVAPVVRWFFTLFRVERSSLIEWPGLRVTVAILLQTSGTRQTPQ